MPGLQAVFTEWTQEYTNLGLWHTKMGLPCDKEYGTNQVKDIFLGAFGMKIQTEKGYGMDGYRYSWQGIPCWEWGTIR